MLHRLVSLPLSVARFTLGSVVLLAQVAMLDHMIRELHR
jgi:hypothetical protein